MAAITASEKATVSLATSIPAKNNDNTNNSAQQTSTLIDNNKKEQQQNIEPHLARKRNLEIVN